MSSPGRTRSSRRSKSAPSALRDSGRPGRGAVHGVEDVAGVPGVRIREVAAGGHAEEPDHRVGVGAAHLADLVEAPQVELALDPLGVGVLGREEAPLLVTQVPLDVGDGLLDHGPVPRLAGHEEGPQVGAEQQGLVVEHLLEVGHEPERVGRVAREATADVVVDPAGGHGVERGGDHREHLRVRVAHVPPQEEVDRHRGWELGRRSEASEARVELLAHRGQRVVEHVLREVGELEVEPDPLLQGVARNCVAELLGLVERFVASIAPDVVDRLHDPDEAGHALTVLAREVRAAEERTAVGREEHGHRPAAATGQRLHRVHVDRVDVGALLPVHLHVHEEPVHHLGDRRVLERLVRHHVAPVTRRVPHREQDRAVARGRLLERLVAPRVPVDGVLRVLAEVRAGLRGEPIGHERTLARTHHAYGAAIPRCSIATARAQR